MIYSVKNSIFNCIYVLNYRYCPPLEKTINGCIRNRLECANAILRKLSFSDPIVRINNSSRGMVIEVYVCIDNLTFFLKVTVQSLDNTVVINPVLVQGNAKSYLWHVIYQVIEEVIQNSIGSSSINDDFEINNYNHLYPPALTRLQNGVFSSDLYTEEDLVNSINCKSYIHDFQSFVHMITIAVFNSFSCLTEDDFALQVIDILGSMIKDETPYVDRCSAVAVIKQLCEHMHTTDVAKFYVPRLEYLIGDLCNIIFSTRTNEFDTALLHRLTRSALYLVCRSKDAFKKVSECIDRHKLVNPDYNDLHVDVDKNKLMFVN